MYLRKLAKGERTKSTRWSFLKDSRVMIRDNKIQRVI